MRDGGDPNIELRLTGPAVEECFELRLGQVVVRMHARSLVDLHGKIGEAFLDWIAAAGFDLAALLRDELER